MRYLIVIIPIILGCIDLALKESNIFGWMFIGIGTFFLVAQLTNFNGSPKNGSIKFDWFSCVILMVFAFIFLINFLNEHQESDLLCAVGFTLAALSKTDVLIASMIKNEGSPLLKKAKKIVNTEFQTALKFAGLGFVLSSLLVRFG